jgi:hypothetical protein
VIVTVTLHVRFPVDDAVFSRLHALAFGITARRSARGFSAWHDTA